LKHRVYTAEIDRSLTTKQAIFTVPAGTSFVVLGVSIRNAVIPFEDTTKISFGFNDDANNVMALDYINVPVSTTNRTLSSDLVGHRPLTDRPFDPDISQPINFIPLKGFRHTKSGEGLDVFYCKLNEADAGGIVDVDVIGYQVGKKKSIITAEELFDFVGAPADIRLTNKNVIEALIEREQSAIENELGRSVVAVEFFDVPLSNLNASFCGSRLYLNGRMRDIQAVYELYNNEDLLAVVDASLGVVSGDYYINHRLGVLEKASGDWSLNRFGVVISGVYGLVDDEGEPLEDIKQLLIEKVASKSRLWKTYVITDGGRVEVTKDQPTTEAKQTLKRYKMMGV
jgi:hypothetical protein